MLLLGFFALRLLRHWPLQGKLARNVTLLPLSPRDKDQPHRDTAPVLRLRLLGPMTVEDPAGRVSLPRTRKTRAILAILALASPRPVLRLTLIGLLWSQRQKEQARASLRQAVHELQDVLGPGWGQLLHAERHHLALHGSGLSIDALNLGDADASRLDTLRMLQHDLLEDLVGLDPAFDRWLADERVRLSRTAVALGETVLADRRDPPAVLEAAEHLLRIDRGHEGAWRSVIRCHADAGDRPAALDAYGRCCAALMELGAAGPSPETEDLRARIAGHDGNATTEQPASGNSLVLNRRPGIRLGIMPLRTVDPGHPGHADGLAMGLTEEIVNSLTRFRWLSCVSGSALIAITGGPKSGQLPWDGMDVDFVLDGTLQRGGPRVRLLMRISDMRSGAEVIWARRFDRDGADTLTLQDDLAAEIVAQLEPELLMREGERGGTRRAPIPSSQDLVLRAIPAIYRLEHDGFQAAGAMLEAAVTADPRNASAHAWYAYWHLFLVGQGWADEPEAATRRGGVLAERAVTLDPGDARALTLAGHVRGFLGKQPREACALHDRAIALNPNLALAWCFSGLSLSYLGEHDDALIRMRQAIRMSPSDPHSFFFDMAMVLPSLLLGDYEKAVEFGRRAIELNPGFSSSYKLYLSALGHLDRGQEAESVTARLLLLEPDFSVSSALERAPMTRLIDLNRYADGLRRAGLPERHCLPRSETVDLAAVPPHSPPQRGMARAISWETGR